MAEEGFKRKLTAILSDDVEGYSRLRAASPIHPHWETYHCKFSPVLR